MVKTLSLLLLLAVQGGIAQTGIDPKLAAKDVIGKECHVGKHWERGNYVDDSCPKTGSGWCGLSYGPTTKYEDYDYYHCVINPAPAKPSNVSSDKKSDQDEFHGGPTKTCSRNPYALDACTPQYPLSDGQVQEVSRPDDVYHDTNVSSDTPKWKIWPPVNWDGASRPPWEKPAPQPLVEKAVADTNKGHCKPCLETNCTMDCKWEFSYTCPKHDGFHVFLLPDEQTGEKFCLSIPKETE